MTIESIARATNAANRFLSLATAITHETSSDGRHKWIGNTGKATGELRRASLDLTRRLAEMRNPHG
jgi:hypothetical protein